MDCLHDVKLNVIISLKKIVKNTFLIIVYNEEES